MFSNFPLKISMAAVAMPVAWLCLWSAAVSVFADEVVSGVPFVAGFDRFGRHAEIDPVTAGHLLLTELSCTACHATDNTALDPKRGPVLDGVGSRLNSSWIRSFLLSPPDAQPGTTMPDMLNGVLPEHREAAADAMTAFLMSLQQPFPEIKASGLIPVPMEFWKHGNAEHGQRLYHQIGCVACHDPDTGFEVTVVKPSPLDEMVEQLNAEELNALGLSSAARKVQSVPLAVLPAKYTHRSLTHFLLNPEQTRPAGRMPNLSLTPVDAADIAAWLLRDQELSQNSDDPESGTKTTLIQQGRQLFSDLNCASCHAIRGLPATTHARPFNELMPESSKSCVAKTANSVARSKGQPNWRLDAVQTAAIMAATVALNTSTPTVKTDALTFHLLQLNCYACHDRNQLGGVDRFRKPYFETVGHVDIGDEGRLPPTLTGAGEKLTTNWINSVLAGQGHVRPFMSIRMPVFPAEATKPLPAMFENADTSQVKSLDSDNQSAAMEKGAFIEAGRKLMDTGCVQCHAFKGEALPGTIGVDLEGVTQRIRRDWLYKFLKDPGSLKPRTRMPTFFPNGQSQNRDVLNGDVGLQIAAMYAYLSELSHQPLPDRIQQARDQNYELTPTDHPIVLRTFMPVAGMHAIAVGFPESVHFAFDAEHIGLSQAWRGRFLDAEGTWFIRFTPPAEPLGDQRITFPTGICLATLTDMTTPWPEDAGAANAAFSGYRLDKTGVPEFLYNVHGIAVIDRTEPDGKNKLKRTITLRGIAASTATEEFWFRAHMGTKLLRTSPRSFVNETELTVTLDAPEAAGETRSVANMTEWLVPVPVSGETVIRVHYAWQ